MDNKNFNADQSIELIQRMIRDTRRNLSSGSSNLFILWGYLLAATAVGIFLLLTFTESRAWQWLWLPALAAGWAATWWYNRRRVSQVKSYTDRLLEQVWGCIAGLAAFSTFVICMEREWPVDPLFPVLLLISAGLFISGTVIHNKYMYYVSCFLLPVAFGIIRESWINVNPDGNLIQFAVAVLVGLAGSGYALKRQVKRDAAEASEKGVNIYGAARDVPSKAVYGEAGNRVRMDDFKGDFVLAVFWSRYCVPCIRELESLNEFARQTKNDGIRVILISPKEEWQGGFAEQRRLLSKYGAPDLETYVDDKSDLAAAFGIFSSPVTVLIGREGKEIGRIRGSAEWDSQDVIEYMYKIKAEHG